MLAVERMTPKGLLRVEAVMQYGTAWVAASLAGGPSEQRLGIATLPTPRPGPDGLVYTHAVIVQHAGTTGQAGLTAAEAAAINVALEQVTAAYQATPTGLRDIRRGLLLDIAVARDSDTTTRERAWARENERHWATVDRAGDIRAAEAALAAFDAAHPEVLAAWDADAERQYAAELDTQITYNGE